MTTCIAPKPGLSGAKQYGCHCDTCSAASREHASRRNRLIAYGRWQPYVDAEPSRQHVRTLMAAGMGWARVAEVAEVSTSTVSALLYGKRGRQPSRRIRPETAQRILTVTAELDLMADSAKVDAVGTHRRIRAMAAIGWPLAYQARQLGRLATNYNRILASGTVEAATHRAVADLYKWLTASPVPRDRYADRAREKAAAAGWCGPEAWDDTTIDDPNAQPIDLLPDPVEVVDEVAIELVRQRKAPWKSLRWQEEVEIYRQLAENGMSETTIQSRYGVSRSRTAKLRAAAFPLAVEPDTVAEVRRVEPVDLTKLVAA